MSFKEWLLHWYNTYKALHLAKDSASRTLGIVNNHIIPKLGKILVSKLDHDILQMFLNGYIDTPNTQKKIYDIVHGSLEIARKTGKIKLNPADGLVLKRYTKKKRRALQIDEQLLVFNTLKIRNTKYLRLFMFSCCTGIRIGRVLEIDRNDIDAENGIIRVKMKQKLGLEETYPVPFLPELLEGLPKEGRIFADVTKSSSQDFFDRVFGELGLKNITIHSFRHTFISMLYFLGVPLKQIQVWAGHKTMSITVNNQYGHTIKKSNKAVQIQCKNNRQRKICLSVIFTSVLRKGIT